MVVTDLGLQISLCLVNCVLGEAEQGREVFLSKEESGSLNCAPAGIQMWSHLGLGLGACRGPQEASLEQVGSSTWSAESRLLPFPEIQPSGKFFLKAATAVPPR